MSTPQAHAYCQNESCGDRTVNDTGTTYRRRAMFLAATNHTAFPHGNGRESRTYRWHFECPVCSRKRLIESKMEA